MWTAAAAHAAGLTPVVIIVAGRIDLLVSAAPGVAAGEVARVVLVICGRDECNLQDKNVSQLMSLKNIYQVPDFLLFSILSLFSYRKIENCQMV